MWIHRVRNGIKEKRKIIMKEEKEKKKRGQETRKRMGVGEGERKIRVSDEHSVVGKTTPAM